MEKKKKKKSSVLHLVIQNNSNYPIRMVRSYQFKVGTLTQQTYFNTVKKKKTHTILSDGEWKECIMEQTLLQALTCSNDQKLLRQNLPSQNSKK